MKRLSQLFFKILITILVIISASIFMSCSNKETITTPSINLESSNADDNIEEGFENLKPNEAENTPHGPAGMGDARPGDMGPGGNNAPTEYSAVNTYTKDQNAIDLNIISTGDDESAILVDNNARVNINNFTLKRESENSSGGDAASFYGVGAAALVTNGTLSLNSGSITSNSKGGAGVFAYGKGTAYVNNAIINTENDTSGGLHVAGGGKLYATNVTATTNGESSAAIRSDKGGGTMEITGGTFTSNGKGSPALYCTADITVNDADLISNGSEGICIEGLNTTTLKNVNLTSNMPDLDQNDNTWSVIVYQSMSGDSEVGKGTFNMEGGSINSTNGGLFYTTNTESEINLKNVTLNPSDDFEFLLQATGNNNKRGWGSKGKNGANCTFNANNQILEGKILYDSISTLTFNLTNNSVYTGEIIDDESYVGDAVGDGYANVTIDETSKWVVTSDCIIYTLVLKGKLVDTDGNDVNILDVNGDMIREGNSDISVTVGVYNKNS
ncbi:MAG: hypothetical protein IJ593_06675 [Lachnospiraceae bacterium]|nr:hypothetical protein [Lachnospiraceae bacterium]